MIYLKKQFLFSFSALITLTATAQTENRNAQFQASAEVSNACIISMQNVSFGVLPSSPTISDLRVSENLKLRCNNNTTVAISAIGSTNEQGFTEKFMTLGGTSVIQNGNNAKPNDAGILYHLMTNYIETNEDFTLIQKHKNQTIIKNFGGDDYRLILKTNTSNEFNVPFLFGIDEPLYNQNKFFLKAGDYSDTISLTLDF